MSLQTVDEFRKRINSDPKMQAQASAALNTSVEAVVAMGHEYGYEFTATEASNALDQYAKDAELSDFELELVSAGSNCPTNGESSNSGAADG